MNVALDNRLYALQQTKLPADLDQLVQDADRHWLQDRDAEAEALVTKVEAACRERGIPIWQPPPEWLEAFRPSHRPAEQKRGENDI